MSTSTRLAFVALLAVACGGSSGTDGAGGGSSSGAPNGGGDGQPDGGGGGQADGGGTGCVDRDGDGAGEGCAKPDCDDTERRCAADCTDADGSGVPDCRDARGAGVFVFTGANGDGPDHSASSVKDVFVAAGIPADTADELPAGFLADFGVLVLDNPREAVPIDVVTTAKHLLRRGGRVVSIVDHSGYGGHEPAKTVLSAIGSSMHSNPTLVTGYLDLVLTPIAPLTDGVTAINPYWSASVSLGAGIALGKMADGYVAIGYERVGNGEVVVIGDASMFGFGLERADNRKFIVNLGRFAP